MKTIKKELAIGEVTVITTTLNKRENGITEVLVESNNYDDVFDDVSLETELGQETVNTMYNIFKPL